MTLQQLKYALTIARSGSINEAAKQLFISQPSLSDKGFHCKSIMLSGNTEFLTGLLVNSQRDREREGF